MSQTVDMERCDDEFEEIGELSQRSIAQDILDMDVSKELKLLGYSERYIRRYQRSKAAMRAAEKKRRHEFYESMNPNR